MNSKGNAVLKKPLKKRNLFIYLAIGLLLYGVVLWLLTPKPSLIVSYETTRITEPLHPAGGVDYEKAINDLRSQGVTPDNNAFVLLLPFWSVLADSDFRNSDSAQRLVAALGIDELPAYDSAINNMRLDVSIEQDPEIAVADKRQFLERLSGEVFLIDDSCDPWNPTSYPMVDRWIEQNSETLDMLPQILGRKHFFAPRIGAAPNSEPPLIASAWPMPFISRLLDPLAFRCRRSIGQRQFELAIQDLHCLIRLADHLETNLNLAFEGAKARRLSTRLLEALLNYHALSSEQIRRLQKQLNSMQNETNWLDVLDMEYRWLALDTMQSIYLSPQSFAAEFQLEDPLGSSISLWGVNSALAQSCDIDTAMRTFNGLLDDMLQDVKGLLYCKQLAISEAARKERITNKQVKKKLTRWGAKYLYRAGSRARDLGSMAFSNIVWHARFDIVDSIYINRIRVDLARIAIALEQHKFKTGRFPMSMSKLSPDFLDKIPTDPFHRVDYQYKPSGNGYLLYAFGPDGVDNGGLRGSIADATAPGEDICFIREPVAAGDTKPR